MPVFVEGQHLHRDVPGRRILLQVVQHRPAQHVGQENIQRNGRRMILVRERKRFRAARGHQNFKSLVAGKIAQDARIVRIVLDDQQDGIVRVADYPGRREFSRPDVRRMLATDNCSGGTGRIRFPLRSRCAVEGPT